MECWVKKYYGRGMVVDLWGGYSSTSIKDLCSTVRGMYCTLGEKRS